jgi:hypothetical protein
MKSLEKDPEKRYQSAQEMQTALEAFIARSGRPASTSDIAEYMRNLFKERIEEKQKILELASREDFGGQASFDDEATERARPHHLAQLGRDGGARIVVGPSPSQMGGYRPGGLPAPRGSFQGVPHPQQTGVMPPTGSFPPMGMQGPSGSSPGGAPNARMTNSGFPQLTGMIAPPGSVSMPGGYGAPPQPEPQSGWVPHVIIAAALLVIVVAVVQIIRELRPPDVVPPPEGSRVTNPLTQVGQIEVDSVPSGAIIYVNGNTVKVDKAGTIARTPVTQITNLRYGEKYQLRLEKEGYETFATTFTMGADVDKTKLKPTLTAIPGTIAVEVGGPDARDVTILFDDKKVSMGPTYEAKLNPGTVRVTAELPNQVCSAVPEEVVVQPAGRARTTIRCQARGARPAPVAGATTPGPNNGSSNGGGARPPPRDPSPGGESRPVAAARPGKSGDCVLLDGLPPGKVTIDTVPYSEIFHDGKKLGDTPLANQKLPSGCLELVAKDPVTQKAKTVKLRVEPNKTLRYRFELEKL